MVNKGAELQKNKGNEFFKKGQHAEAIECYTFATEMDPTNHKYFTNRSNAYYQMGKYDKSLRDALKATKLDSNWEKGWFRAGMAQMELEQYEAAKKNFQQACDLKPDNASFKQELAKAKAALMKGMTPAAITKMEGNEFFKNGDIDNAIEKYTTAIDMADPNTDAQTLVDALSNRAACYRQHYKPEKCVEDCTRALEIQPTNVKALIRRAQSLEQLEKFKEALKDFEKVNQLTGATMQVACTGASRIRSALKRNNQL